MLSRLVRWIAFSIFVVLGLMLALTLAALACAWFPLSGRAQQAAGEPPLYLCASLAHADIVMPSHDPLVDWSDLFPEAAPPGLPAQAYLAFGWGDLRFFQETPNWSDIRVSTALGALAGLDATALRVVAVNPPAENPGCLALHVDREGRQALIEHIRTTLQPDAAGRPQWQPGGGSLEAYYLAKERYSPVRTCNQWAAEALGAAGLPHAWLAPFSFGVTWPLSGTAPSRHDA